MIILGFNIDLNVSVNVGDSVYYVATVTSGTNTDNSTQFTVQSTTSNPVFLGTIDSILTNDTDSIYYTVSPLTVTTGEGDDEVVTTVNTIINVQEDGAIITPPSESFIFFSKDNKYNMSSLTGYYGEVEFRNNSTTQAELFATACETVESSK